MINTPAMMLAAVHSRARRARGAAQGDWGGTSIGKVIAGRGVIREPDAAAPARALAGGVDADGVERLAPVSAAASLGCEACATGCSDAATSMPRREVSDSEVSVRRDRGLGRRKTESGVR